MDKRAWILFGAATVAILAGLIFFSKQEKVDLSNVESSKPITAAKAEEVNSGLPDTVLGKKDSKVVLIEYGDFSCEACKGFHDRLKPVMEEYKDRVGFIYRHFPLSTIHPNARTAAAYTEAAGLQGKFWQMHDKLFTNQKEWSKLSVGARDDQFIKYAKELNLDTNKITEDVGSEKVIKKISFDLALGKEDGVSATPTLLLNDRMLSAEDFQDADAIRSTLNEALKSAK